MSRSANPNKQKKAYDESEAASAARQQKVERERIRRLLITLGDDNKKVLAQIRGLAGALEDDVELHGELMAQTVLDCAKCLPLKSGIYAAWLGKMADKNATWAASVVNHAMDELRAATRVGKASTAQLILRFIVGLGNVGLLGLDSIVQLLKDVLALSEGLKPSKGGDLGVFLALASLPFLSPAAYSKAKEAIDGISAAARPYLAARDARWKSLLRILRSDEVPDRLEACVSVIDGLTKTEFVSQAVLHVPGFEPTTAGKPEMPSIALEIKAEEIRKSKVRMQVPLATSRFVTSNLEGLELESDEPMPDHDRWVLEDYIVLTMEMFGKDVDECSKQVLRIPVLHPHFEAVTVETIFSQMLRLPTPPLLPLFYYRLLEAIAEKQLSTKKLIEKAYSHLFEHASDLDEESLETLAEAFAYHLMHNAYQADWAPFTGDSVAVQGQRFIRRALERLQRLSFHQNLIHRLPEAVHVYVPPEPLAATGLPVQSKPEFTRMLGFIKIKDPSEAKVLRYCHRLLKMEPKAEKKEEEDTTTTGVAELVETTGEASDGKRRKLADGTAEAVLATGDAEVSNEPGEEASGDGKRKKPETTELLRVKEEVKQELHEDMGPKGATGSKDAGDGEKQVDEEDEEFGEAPAEPWPVEDVAELVATAVLQQGAKTPTHMLKVLDGHVQVLLKLRPEDDEQGHSFAKRIVSCVLDFWRLSGQRLEITVDSLLNKGVVTPRSVVETALAERGAQGCDSMPVWNIINGVARKSLERSQTVRVELAIAKKLGKEDVLEKSRKQLDDAIHENAELFMLIFTGLVRNYQDFEDCDNILRTITLQRILVIGRKYLAFIKPLVDAAESRIPGVAHNPEVAAVFRSLSTL